VARASIEDRTAIEDLFVRYTIALDSGDVDGVVSCFTEDGWLDSPITGRRQGVEQLRAFAGQIARSIEPRGARFRHVVSNFRFDVEGDRARARCYLLDFVTIGGETTLLSPGEYDCEVVKRDEGWLFASRIVRMDRPFAIP
jgi:uncharacterized protein (TIGR02246 family)